MNDFRVENSSWVAGKLQERVSYTAWFVATMIGLWMWTIIFRVVVG